MPALFLTTFGAQWEMHTGVPNLLIETSRTSLISAGSDLALYGTRQPKQGLLMRDRKLTEASEGIE